MSTIESISYGITTPEHLLAKLKADGERLTANPDPYDVFNFIITGQVLSEWIKKFYRHIPDVQNFSKALAENNNNWELLPKNTSDWILDRPIILTTGPDIRFHVLNILHLNWEIGNASKHFHRRGKRVNEIQREPIVSNAFDYCFTSCAPDLYVKCDGCVYGLSEIRSVLIQFFDGFLYRIGQQNSAN
jgi:hypothetical protein